MGLVSGLFGEGWLEPNAIDGVIPVAARRKASAFRPGQSAAMRAPSGRRLEGLAEPAATLRCPSNFKSGGRGGNESTAPMSMPVTVTVGVALEMVQCAAEAAISRAADGAAILRAHRDPPCAAVFVRYKAERDGAGRCTSHHCQHHTARTFHGSRPPSAPAILLEPTTITQVKGGDFTTHIARS